METQRVYSTSNLAELALVKHALATADIPFIVSDEGLLAGLGIAAMGGSGCDVKVNVADFETAKSLLCGLDLVCENKN